MPIERHRRRLSNGEQRTYTYQVNPDGSRRALSIRSGSDSDSVIPILKIKATDKVK